MDGCEWRRRCLIDVGGLLVLTPRVGGEVLMLKFLGSTVGIIFLIGLLVVFGLFALIF